MYDTTKLIKIGSGRSAEVFDLDTDKVYRQSFSETDGFIATLYLSNEQRKEYKLSKIIDFDTDNHMWSVCEKLYKTDPDRLVSLNGLWDDINDFRCVPCHLWEDDHELATLISLGIKLFNDLYKMGYPVWDLDMNNHNIMQRSNGELVLTDPIGTLDI